MTKKSQYTEKEREIMKKTLIVIVLLLVFLLPQKAFGHTGLLNSTPGVDEIVVEEVNNVSITFEGDITALSTLNVTKENEDISLSHTEVEGKKITGSFETPLKNGDYIITWNIVGKDGHPMTGEIPFKVMVEEDTAQSNTVLPQASAKTEPSDEHNLNENKEAISFVSFEGLIAIAVFLLLCVYIIVRKRKKDKK